MKHILSALLTALMLVLMCLKISAQTPSIVETLDSTPGVTIILPDALKARLDKSTATSAAAATPANVITPRAKASVFRVEVYADNSRNAKNQAQAKRRNMQTRFPQYPSVLAFESPFWRVRVGEFRSRGDAESAMADIRQAFPSYGPYLRIVRD